MMIEMIQITQMNDFMKWKFSKITAHHAMKIESMRSSLAKIF